MRFQTTTPLAGLSLALGVQEVRPVDLVTAYGTLANQGRFIDHTTILLVKDRNGTDALPPYDEKPAGTPVASPEAAGIVTDILAGNTNPQVNPFWGRFQIVDANKRRPATLKTGTNNDAKDLNAYGFIAPPAAAGRAAGEHALVVGVWNGNSDNTVVSTPQKPIFSIDVSTFVWQGFMAEATKGWAINDFQRPTTLVTAEVDPWTGLRPSPGGPSVKELFIRGTEPQRSVGISGGICGEAVLSEAYEGKFDRWMAADRDWLRRAGRGPGVAGGPDRTRTAYFYNNSFNPYGRSWGPVLNGAGCESPGPSPTCFPVPTPDPSGVIPSFAIPTPVGSGPAPLPCPAATPLESPTAEVTPTPTTEPPPSLPPPSVPPPPSPTPPPTPSPLPSTAVSAPPAIASPPPAVASGAP
jgi:membrane peptidoglycan carboxypeptidase